MKVEKLGEGTHVNMLNKNEKKGDLQRIYTKNLDIECKIRNEVIDRNEKISDHAMIFMNCKNKKIEPGVGGRRMIIPNSKTSDKILDMIKDGDSWEDIHKTIYANEKMLKKRTKPIKDMMKEQCMKIQLEKQASEELVKSIEKTSYEGFKKYVEMLGQEIGGKESGVGWKGLKNLSKYPLLGGKKENQFQVKVLDKNGNEV